MKVDSSLLHNRKVTSLTNPVPAELRIFGKWLLGWVSWRGVSWNPASNLTPLKESDPLQGTVRKDSQELDSLVADDFFRNSFIFEVMGAGEPAVFFFWEGELELNNVCFVEVPEFWRRLGWLGTISFFGELLISLLFGAVIHMGSCLMTGWQAFPDPKWGAETKKPIESTKNYRVV